jgi:hypothetical protein
MSNEIKLFTSEHCKPCHELLSLVNKGRFVSDLGDAGVNVVDVETEEGFNQIQEYNLLAVPQAFHGKKTCRLQIDDENEVLIITCKDDVPETVPESQEEKPQS